MRWQKNTHPLGGAWTALCLTMLDVAVWERTEKGRRIEMRALEHRMTGGAERYIKEASHEGP